MLRRRRDRSRVRFRCSTRPGRARWADRPPSGTSAAEGAPVDLWWLDKRSDLSNARPGLSAIDTVRAGGARRLPFRRGHLRAYEGVAERHPYCASCHCPAIRLRRNDSITLVVAAAPRALIDMPFAPLSPTMADLDVDPYRRVGSADRPPDVMAAISSPTDLGRGRRRDTPADRCRRCPYDVEEPEAMLGLSGGGGRPVAFQWEPRHTRASACSDPRRWRSGECTQPSTRSEQRSKSARV